MTEKEFRWTRQRRIILEEIRRMHSHPSADDVYNIVRRRIPDISLATVYRNLEMLSEFGVIKKIHSGGKQQLYDAVSDKHYHFHCRSCGRILDVAIPPIQAVENSLEQLDGFDVHGHSIEFYGTCPNCNKEN